jgi:hypothetical protein
MFIVEMHRIPRPTSGYDLFDCPGPLWDTLKKLGESYGWKPMGTVPSPGIPKAEVEAEEKKLAEYRASVPPNWREVAKRLDDIEREKLKAQGKNSALVLSGPGCDMYWKYSQLDLYMPRDWGRVVRMVTAEDAANWADALNRALEHMESLNIDLPHEGPGIVNENMHVELNELMNGGLKRDFTRAFSTYIRRGGFGFAWDD